MQDFVINGNSGNKRGVLVLVDGVEHGQAVTFAVTLQHRKAQTTEHTGIANNDGVASWRVTRDDTGSRGPALGTYDVVTTFGDNDDDVLNGSFEVAPNLKEKGKNGPKSR